MFKENWRKIWALAEMRDCPVDHAFDEFLKAVQFDKPIEGVDFDFHAAHEAWKAMTHEEQQDELFAYRVHCGAGYWKRVKEYNNDK